MRPARVGLAVGLAYIGMNGAISAHASREVERIAKVDSNVEYGRRVIASPVPLAFWKREAIYTEAKFDGDLIFARYKLGNWSLFSGLVSEVTIPDRPCNYVMHRHLGKLDSKGAALFFWSRTPFLERADDGSVILYDARFYDPRARDRFSVALPDVKCEELPKG